MPGISFDPAWSVVFDICVAVALVWLACILSKTRPLNAVGLPAIVVAAVLLCVPVIVIGEVFSLVASFIIVPWLAIAAYHDTEQPLPKRYRTLLSAARIAVFLLVILCLLRPRLKTDHVYFHRACAVVLADVSASMEGKDSPPAATRYAALKDILDKNDDAIDELREECDYRFATFADSFERTEELPEQPVGLRTDFAATFTGVMRDLAGAKLAGLVLISDGRNNGPGDPVAMARRLGAPVFTVCLGARSDASLLGDSSVQSVDCPERVFLKNLAAVRVRVAYSGPETDDLIDVSLSEDDRRIGNKRIKMPKPGKTVDVELEYMPETEGIKRLVVDVTRADQDPNIRNNTREIFVRASEAALGVIFVEGEVRWEYKFLRRAIGAAANIKLTSVHAFLADDSDRAKFLPETEEEWAGVSLIILGDIPAGRFAPAQLERIKTFVAEGGSLLMLGGFNTLGPGGYGSTPLADILPVDVRVNDEQKLGAVRVAPTRDGLGHNILAFGPAEKTRIVWKALPPLSGYTKVTRVKPHAKTLIETDTHDPILVVQQVDRGRTAVFAADTTWRWIFNEGKFAHYHKSFWRQLVQWLTRSGYGGIRSGVWCETDRLRYLTGDVPILTIRVGGRPLENASVSATIEGPGPKQTMHVGNGLGQHTLGMPEPVEKSGEYEVAVTATPKAGKPVIAKVKFVVQQLDIESEKPGADPDLLKLIAEETGGLYFESDDAGKAFDAVLSRTDGAKLVKPKYKPLWDNVFVYIALCALLCAEWIARKRRGLA